MAVIVQANGELLRWLGAKPIPVDATTGKVIPLKPKRPTFLMHCPVVGDFYYWEVLPGAEKSEL